MADLTVTATKVAPVFPDQAEIRTYIAAVAVTAGQPVYINSSGKVALADANVGAAEHFRGIALETVGAGQPVSILRRGEVYGFDLSGVAFDAQVFVSDTAGSLADAAGTTSLVAGRCQPLADSVNINKVLMIDATGIA